MSNETMMWGIAAVISAWFLALMFPGALAAYSRSREDRVPGKHRNSEKDSEGSD